MTNSIALLATQSSEMTMTLKEITDMTHEQTLEALDFLIDFFDKFNRTMTFKNSKIGSVVVKPTKESCVPHTEQYMELLAQAARDDMNGSEEDEFYLI